MNDFVSISCGWKKPYWERYYQAKSIGEAIQILEEFKGESKIIAGGTDLIAQIRKGGLKVRALVDITRIPGLGDIKMEDGLIRLGAMLTHKEISSSLKIKDKLPSLTQAASQVGTPQIRNLGTLGGNLCNASPAADLAPPLLIFEARVRVSGREGEREIPVESFFKGPGQTVLEPYEILNEVIIPEIPEDTSTIFIKLGRRKGGDLAIVSVAMLLSIDRKDKSCRLVRIGLGSVAPIPIRAKATEASLFGKVLDTHSIKEAGDCAKRESQPISDVRGSSEYRREMVKVMVERALRRCLERLEEKNV